MRPISPPTRIKMNSLAGVSRRTNPQDAQSYLRVENISLASGAHAVSLRFVATANKTCTVESRRVAEAGA
jgi:hypothetical protein